MHIAVRKGDIDDINLLLQNGADINLPGDIGNTPLHYAAMTEQIDAIIKLLSFGENPDLKNEFGQTPLKVAELGKHKNVVKIFGKEKQTRNSE